MTVEQLVKKLLQMPMDADVMLSDGEEFEVIPARGRIYIGSVDEMSEALTPLIVATGLRAQSRKNALESERLELESSRLGQLAYTLMATGGKS